jgi:tyrosyl-tRNA synthetase
VRAEAASRALFGQGDLKALDEPTLAAALDEVPATAVQVPTPLQVVMDPNGSREAAAHDGAGSAPRSVLSKAGPVQVESRIPAVSELMARTGIVESRSAARRAIAAGGAYLNNRRVTDADEAPGAKDLLHGRFLVLRRGRRTVGGVEVLVSERSPA